MKLKFSFLQGDGYRRELVLSFKIAWPLVISMLAQIGISVIDNMMLGVISPQALAAGALALSAYVLLLVFSLGLTSAVGVCIAHAKGKNNTQEITHYLHQGFYFVAIISIPMMLLIWKMPAVLLALDQKPVLVTFASRLLHGLVWGYPALLGFILLREFLSNFYKSLIIALISLCALPLNAMIDYLIVSTNYFSHLSVVNQISGIALSTSLIEWFKLAILLLYLLFHPQFKSYLRTSYARINWSALKQFCHLGIPTAFVFLFEAGLFSIATIMVGWIDTTTLAAYQIVMQCVDIAFMFFLGIAQATSLRVAQHSGANKSQLIPITAYANLLLGLLTAIIIALLIHFSHLSITHLFTRSDHSQNTQIITLTTQFFTIAMPFLFFDVIQVICNNALRGMKDTIIPMWLGLGSYWVVGMGCAYTFAFMLPISKQDPGQGLWWGLTVGVMTSAIILFSRLQIVMRRQTVDIK